MFLFYSHLLIIFAFEHFSKKLYHRVLDNVHILNISNYNSDLQNKFVSNNKDYTDMELAVVGLHHVPVTLELGKQITQHMSCIYPTCASQSSLSRCV